MAGDGTVSGAAAAPPGTIPVQVAAMLRYNAQ
jgi:hypothetical protein